MTALPMARLLPLQMAVPAVGLTEMPGHENASCGGWPQCANLTDPKCGCLVYGWNETSLRAFIADAVAAGVFKDDAL